LIAQNRLTFVKGIGQGLAMQIAELYTTGQSSLLNQLRSEMGPGIVELTAVPGLSVKKVQLLHEALSISTGRATEGRRRSRKAARHQGLYRQDRSKTLEAIAANQNREQRIHIHQALRAGEAILEFLKTSRDFGQAEFGGSLRRWKETVSQIVVVASAKKPQALIDHFVRFPLVMRTEEKTSGRVVVTLSEGFKATLIAVTPKEFAVALFNATGSQRTSAKADRVRTSPACITKIKTD
jgi:DNA polymerase (family 10)